MKSKAFSVIKFLIGWPFSILALIFVFQKTSLHTTTITQNIRSCNFPLLFLGIGSFLLYYFLRAIIWQYILKAFSYRLPLRETIFLWTTSELKRYIPGNIWSFLGRSVVFAEREVKKKDIGIALLIEAQLIVFGAILFSLLSLPFVSHELLAFVPLHTYFPLFLTIYFLGLSVLYIWREKLPHRLVPTKSLLRFILPRFPPAMNAQLLILSVFSFFFYGLGYFLAIMSVVPLPLTTMWQFSSFFTLAYLIGYLSIITPTGLGVREGTIVVGLMTVISSTLAGVAAIFSRVVLILTELVFVGLSLLYYKLSLPALRRAEKYISAHPYEIILGVMIAVYIMYFTIASFYRYDNFYTGRFDLGNMAQTVWNTAHGRIFQITNPDGTEVVSRLATHADFILIFLAPFYYLWPNPKMLLLIQTVVLAAGAYFVYLLGVHFLKKKPWALLFALLYLGNPGVQWTNLYDFHANVLATTFLLGALYFCLKRKYQWFLIFAVLAALTKEEVWAIIGIFGLYIALFQKKYKPGTILFAVCMGLFYFIAWKAIPHAAATNHHFALSYFSTDAQTPTGLIKGMLLSPLKTLAKVFQPGKIEFLLQIFSPVAFLSVFSPLYLIFAGPDFALSLLSDKPELHQIYYQYTATLTPFIFISAIAGTAWLLKRIPYSYHFVVYSLLVFCGFHSLYSDSPLPGMKRANVAMFTEQIPNRVEIDQKLNTIPSRYSVAASNNLGSHLSQRERIYTIPYGIGKADIIVFLLNDPFAQPSPKVQKKMVDELKHNINYSLSYQAGNFVVFKKKSI